MPAGLCSPSVVHHRLLGAEGLPKSPSPSLSCDNKPGLGGKHEVARWSICAITPSAVKPLTPSYAPACVVNADRVTCLVHCRRMALQLRLFKLSQLLLNCLCRQC